MSSYSNYLGSKKCCATNLAKTVTGPQGPQGTKGAIGPFGYQGVTGSQGLRGATGPCCRGPTGVPGVTGAQGADGAAGGNGGLPLFLNYSVNHIGPVQTGLPTYPSTPAANLGPIEISGTGGYIPSIQATESNLSPAPAADGIIVEYNVTGTQEFITTLPIGTTSIPAGFYTLYLYAYIDSSTGVTDDWNCYIIIYSFSYYRSRSTRIFTTTSYYTTSRN
jgi:hypothetical protein